MDLSCENRHFAFFLTEIEKERSKSNIEKKKRKMPILAAKSRSVTAASA